MARRIVTDFDGTIVRMPRGTDLSKNLDYIKTAQPNKAVADYLSGHGADEIVVLTGRVDGNEVKAWCDAHGIRVNYVVSTPASIWATEHPVDNLRQFKRGAVDALQPDVIIEDDRNTLAILDAPERFLVVDGIMYDIDEPEEEPEFRFTDCEPEYDENPLWHGHEWD